jgi:hypothetical protein
MQDQWENPDNQKYYTEISGTSNMSTVLLAPVLASKGHYYQFADKYLNKTSILVDSNNTEIAIDPDRDDTYLGIEKISGVNVQARQRLQMNFQIKKDLLFSQLQDEFFVVPLVFVKRDSIMTQTQVSSILGDLYTA